MILAIDLGSTSFKASVFDASLECVGEGSSELVYHHGPHGVMQLDPGHLRETLRSAVAQALSAADVTALGAVAVTSQAQTFTVCSPEGVERVPFISWLDSGCAEYNPAADALPEFARHCSVEQCMPSLMVAKLAYLQEQSEGTFVGADDTVLMLPAWVVRQMTGTAAVDKNLAAMCCLYSLLEDDWWSEALRACRIGEHNLPALKELGAVAGNTGQGAAAFGLPTGIPVVLAGNDQTAGAYGVDVHRKNAVLITLGTAQVAYDVCEQMPPASPGTMRGPYLEGLFFQLAADDFGGATMNWAKTVLEGCETDAAFDEAAAVAAADCNGVTFLADGTGGRGHWEGETSRTTTGDKARAVLICLADRMAGMLEKLERGTADKALLVAGGGSRSKPWLECLEHRLHKPLRRVTGVSPAHGAARMALMQKSGLIQ